MHTYKDQILAQNFDSVLNETFQTLIQSNFEFLSITDEEEYFLALEAKNSCTFK